MSIKWPRNAEDYCIKEAGVGTIVHLSEKSRYEFAGLDKNMLIALFDEDGFLITRINELLSLNYFPSGIKAVPSYVDKLAFEAMLKKATSIDRAVKNSGKPFVQEHPNRTAADNITTLLIHKWELQRERCFICNSRIKLDEQNPMLQISRAMIDSDKKTYDFDNVAIGHYSCILAKNKFSMKQVDDWYAHVTMYEHVLDKQRYWPIDKNGLPIGDPSSPVEVNSPGNPDTRVTVPVDDSILKQ